MEESDGLQISPPEDEETEALITTESTATESAANSKNVKIVLAGKSGAGKTSLCKALLGLENDIPLTPRPDTEVAEPHEIQKNGIKITIIDTPGFINKDVKYTQNDFDLLVYCMPVSPGTKFDEHNPVIMQTLQDKYGKDIWRHCIVAFTFSNLAYDRCKKKSKPEDEYKAYIDDCRSEFEKRLKQLHVLNITVKTIFNHGPDHLPDHAIIKVIPAGDEPEDPLLPGVVLHEGSKGWIDEMFLEMIKKCKCNERLAQFRFGHELGKKILMMLKVPIGAAWSRGLPSILEQSFVAV